jgi:hypothetical protein
MGKTICGMDVPLPDGWGLQRHMLITFSVHKVSCLRCLYALDRKMNRLTEVQLVHLHVSTLIGSLGATHWYAELQTEDDDGELQIIELSHPLLTAEALDLNKSEEYTMMRDFRVGEAYKGFWSREKAIEAGHQQWREQCPEGKFLVLGRALYEQPKIVVDTIYEDGDALKTAAVEIVDKCRAIGWFDNPKNDKLMDEYCLQWQVLLKTWLREK